MKLVDIQMVGFQVAKGDLQIFPEIFRGPGAGFGRDPDAVAPAVKSLAQFLFAVCISSGSIVEVDAAVKSLVEQIYRFGLCNSLDRQRAEPVFVDGDPGSPQCYCGHFSFPLS